jgi:hypothetical protein
MAAASLWFVVYIIGLNWLDYRASIFPHRYRRPLTPKSLRAIAPRWPRSRGNGEVVDRSNLDWRFRYSQCSVKMLFSAGWPTRHASKRDSQIEQGSVSFDSPFDRLLDKDLK